MSWCPSTPVNPRPPLRLVMVFPVAGLTISPVRSWSEMLNIIGTPSTTFHDIMGRGWSSRSFNSVTSIAVDFDSVSRGLPCCLSSSALWDKVLFWATVSFLPISFVPASNRASISDSSSDCSACTWAPISFITSSIAIVSVSVSSWDTPRDSPFILNSGGFSSDSRKVAPSTQTPGDISTFSSVNSDISIRMDVPAFSARCFLVSSRDNSLPSGDTARIPSA